MVNDDADELRCLCGTFLRGLAGCQSIGMGMSRSLNHLQ